MQPKKKTLNKVHNHRFWKYQSEGNDFVILTAPSGKHPLENTRSIRHMCNRITGVGANGVIVLVGKPGKPWIWRFYNEDGSQAKMCGNGAKCAALWLNNHGGFKKGSIKWMSRVGPVEATTDSSNKTWVTWPINFTEPNKKILLDLGEILDGLNERGLAYLAHINTGVPHLVFINHEAWSQTDRSALSAQLRNHPIFGKEGTNVSWHSLSTGESVTFERGVEAETLACGTGALAIFLALEDMKRKPPSKGQKFPGGFLPVKRGQENKLWLGGKPQEVFVGEI